MSDRPDVSREVNRYIDWMAATFEVQNGKSLRQNRTAMERLGEIARIAHAQRGAQNLHVDGLLSGCTLRATLTEDELDAIFDGTTRPPTVRPPAEEEDDFTKTGERVTWILLGTIVLIFAAGAVFETCHSHHHESPAGEHQKRN